MRKLFPFIAGANTMLPSASPNVRGCVAGERTPRPKQKGGRARAFAWSLVLLLLCSPFLYGQIRSATVTGTVTDPSGGAVVGAEVVLENNETNVESKTKSTDAREFALPYRSEEHTSELQSRQYLVCRL